MDAQYGTDETWDYYKQVHGRNGIFGTGKGSFNRVHYGKNYVNAFWDGTKMTYGDGDGRSYGPLTSLDVAGHEMSHGVTENSAGLTYSGESGGLNESTSDIFGTSVEFFAANAKDPGDYLIGEQFDLAKHQGFRRMDKPSSDGSSADCWSATVGQLDVHYSSGVGNHFFYLLSEGSGAKTLNGVSYSSPTCNGAPAVDRDRPRRGREDLVPRADRLHDVQHRLPRCAHRVAARRPRTCTARAARSTPRSTPPGRASTSADPPPRRPPSRDAPREGGSMPKVGGMSTVVPANMTIVTLGVTDLDRSVHFYSDLGWERRGNLADGITWFRTSGSWLGLFGHDALAEDARLAADAARRPAAVPGGVTLALNLARRRRWTRPSRASSRSAAGS